MVFGMVFVFKNYFNHDNNLLNQMKMKKLSIITAFMAILFCGLTTAMAQNTTTNNPKVVKFVEQHFPEATIQTVLPDDDDIDVVLSDFTKIEFRLNYEWKKVDCEYATTYTSVPATLVPEQIAAYVTASFPKAIIIQLEKKFYGWEIELDNGLEIKFNKDFKVTKIDD